MKREQPKDDVDGAAADGAEDGSQSAWSTEGSADAANGDVLINSVNKMAPGEFKERYIPLGMLQYSTKGNDHKVILDFKASSELSSEELSSCFNLIETTSRADYEPSSFGWHPKRKRREMLEEEMRYLLVRDADDGKKPSVSGFLSFMMTHDSTPSVPVLYIYEVHLDEGSRGSGLGSHLMGLTESTAEKVGVEKVMLTCFLSNEKALGLYRKRGYEKDVCSPDNRRTRKKVVKVDYVIMSKSITGAATETKEKFAG